MKRPPSLLKTIAGAPQIKRWWWDGPASAGNALENKKTSRYFTFFLIISFGKEMKKPCLHTCLHFVVLLKKLSKYWKIHIVYFKRVYLTNFMPLVSFDTSWKGLSKETRGMKWVKKSLSGAIQKWRHQGRGRGYPKLVTERDKGGRRVHANSDITTKKKNIYKVLLFPCFWSER